MSGRRLRGAAVLGAAALALAVASSAVGGTRLEVQDWDCPPAPASCARPVAVLGFPLPYVSDYHGISPVGRASLSGALVGEDHFHVAAFIGNVAFYLLLVIGTLAAARASLRRATRVRQRRRTDTARRAGP